MTTRMLYVIGEPGAGKTTITQHLTRRCAYDVRNVPYVVWMQYSENVMQLGNKRETFGGTDALGMAAQKHVLAWLEDLKANGTMPRSILAEGDRLANAKFFEAVKEMGIELTVATILVQTAELDRRRRKRNKAVGKAQNEQWLKTRATKVVNLWTDYGTEEWTFDTTEQSAVEVSKALARHPVGREFVKIRKA